MLSRALQKRLRDAFAARGYKLDGTADLSRVCKAPGTLNHKTSPDLKPVRVIQVGERYDRAELLALLSPDLGMASRGLPGAGAGTLAAQLRAEAKKRFLDSGKAKPDELAPILAGCAWLQSIVERAERGEPLEEAEWYAMISIVARTIGGRQRVHEISKLDPVRGRYSFEETEAKIDQALRAAGPALCRETVQEKLRFEGCARCPFRASELISPMNLGPVALAMAEVQRGHVYATKGRTYLHLASGEKLDTEEFGDSVMSKIGRNPHAQMMLSRTTAQVMHRDYQAGVPDLILREPDGTLAVNLWRGGGVEPAAGDHQPILDFLARFIPDTCSREHVIMYLAHLVQHPAVKIEHGIIVTGGFGTGKGTLHRIIKTIFGERNARKIEGVELAEPYTARLVDAQVLMIEEAHHGERLEVFRKMLELMTAEIYWAHDKHIRRFRGRTPRGFFLASNDPAPIVLPRGDRRWFVCSTPDTPETEEEKREHRAFFRSIYALLDRDDTAVAAFAEYLRTLPLDGFNAKGSPPMTAAKEMASEQSRTPTAQVLQELITAGLHPFHKDVLTVAEVTEALKTSATWATSLERLSPQKVARAMQEMGARKVNVDGGDHLEVVIAGRNVRLWAIRNVARWSQANRDELRTEATRPITDANVADFQKARMQQIMEEAARRPGG